MRFNFIAFLGKISWIRVSYQNISVKPRELFVCVFVWYSSSVQFLENYCPTVFYFRKEKGKCHIKMSYILQTFILPPWVLCYSHDDSVDPFFGLPQVQFPKNGSAETSRQHQNALLYVDINHWQQHYFFTNLYYENLW